jgi:predicted transcriptional regulator
MPEGAGPVEQPARPLQLSPDDCRRRREALGLTIYSLAAHARLRESTVLRFEAALVQPRPVTVVALHNALTRLESMHPAVGG